MAYTPDQIKQFVNDQGIGNNPYAMYNYAKQYGVSPGAIDQAMGYDAGTSDKWIQQQGLQGLAGSGVGGTRPTTGNYTDAQINQFITDKGIANNPQAINAYAQQYGVQPGQIDSALGAKPGQSAAWQQQNGLTGQMPPGYAQATPQQPPTMPGAGGPPPSKPNPYAMTGGSYGDTPESFGYGGGTAIPQGPSASGMPASNPYQPNPTASQYQPMAGGGAPQGGPGQQNPYMAQMGQDITRQVTNNLNRNILPNIGRGAVAAGGYGGSRQGVAEGLAVGETNQGLAGQLANLYGTQFNADRNYGLQNDALDLNVYNANQNWMNQGQQNQIGLINSMLGWNQQGINNATTIQNTPLNYYSQFANIGQGLGGLGGTNTQNLQGNPWLGALGGYQLGSKIAGG